MSGVVSYKGLLTTLRPYQREIALSVVGSVLQRRGHSFTVEIARQGGKNELSARIELLLLALHQDRDVTAIKAAPTQKPQALISLDRLWQRVQDHGLAGAAVKEGGNCIRLGRARQLFLSAEPDSNIVGHTADLLLEIDEAQDVDIKKYDKELRPMAANSGATTVLYGTAWDDANLLERSKQTHLEQERRDGIRRHFQYDWQVVAASNADYDRYVRSEQERLGTDHPSFLTQYCLRTLPGAGRLFSPNQLSMMRGSHAVLDGPLTGETYVAGLDVAGEATATGGEHDSTVLTIGRVLMPSDMLATGCSVEVVRQYAWIGVSHTELHGALVSLLSETWRVQRLAIDATGIGEPVAAFLSRALGSARVEAVKLSAPVKSSLGFELLAAVNGGRLRLPAGPDSGEALECWRQLEHCRSVLRPNRTLNFYVEARDGHDDHVISLALLVAAASDAAPRRARGRPREE
ncbi:MAG TPA: hypothetical protein VJB57_06025 [Dehalococcoidia bacterium]|nr:hypothetical protein [Dehalococcoidia bacterium]